MITTLIVEPDIHRIRTVHYMPEIGRFIQEDPHPGETSLPETFLSKYNYAGNNPQRFVDPKGREFFTAVLIFTIAQQIVKSAFEGGSFFENLEKKFRFFGAGDEGGFWKDLAINSILYGVSGTTPGFNIQTYTELGIVAGTTHFQRLEEKYGYGHNALGFLSAGQIGDGIVLYKIGSALSRIPSGVRSIQEFIHEIMVSFIVGEHEMGEEGI